MTHAIELAINAYLVLEKGLGRTRSGGKKRDNHDLMALYEEAIRRGLKSNPLVLKELPENRDFNFASRILEGKSASPSIGQRSNK